MHISTGELLILIWINFSEYDDGKDDDDEEDGNDRSDHGEAGGGHR